MEFLRRNSVGWVRWWPALALMSVVLLTGCTQVMRAEQADRGEQVDVGTFLHDHLQAEPMVTVAEAYRAMLILADGDDEFDSFAAREQALREREIIRSDWTLTREACIDRGTVAYMVCQILRVRGGVNYTLMGSVGIADRRYALRELNYLKLMDRTPDYRYMSGAELVDLIAKADSYMAEHGMYEEETTDFVDMLESGSLPSQ